MQKSRKNSPKSIVNKKDILKLHAYPAFGSKPVKDIKPKGIVKVMNALES